MGAQESNAGDDFHFWWAASRALELIRPGTDSRRLTVEGLAPIDDPDDEYEIADVAEYVGGMDFESADRLLISQLKYSTRHPTRAWTAAQICRKRHRRTTGAKGQSRSVIADLAGTYNRLVDRQGRDAVLQKVRLRLVSNQPPDPVLAEAVTAAATWVRKRGRPVRRADLLQALSSDESSVIGTLATAIGQGLTSTAFCDFLTVLDLSPLGALDRVALARNVRADTIQMSPGAGPDPSLRLFDLVRQQALPDSRREGITAYDILATLDVAELSDLYPAPLRLTDLPDPLPAPSARSLAQAALANTSEIIVAQGAAGAGKTTALRQIADHIPDRSVVLLYDCYGAGEYLNAGEERHTPQRFVMQVINDLAQRCGTPLLLHAPNLEADLWRHFTKTLSRAVDTLSSDAVIVLAVDAADNAAVAAVERGGPSFLPGLLAVRLPSQVTVVLTARSHRVDMTGAASRPRVDVLPFDAATSAEHLRRNRPDVSDADAATFHECTGGNPRSQFYVLDQAHQSGWDMPQLLAACTRTPNALFSDIVDSALRGNGRDSVRNQWLAALLALSRPVSVRTLAEALGVDVAAVLAFAEGLTPGVEVGEFGIRFRDEDFETYVRDRVDPVDVVAAHARLADLLYAKRAEDPDSAAHVADHQFAAGRYGDVLQLVLDEDSPSGIADGFRREQVQGRRLDLAARAAATVEDASIAVRIAARACDTASRLDTLSRVVESQLDLVARYTDVDLLRTYALKQSRGGWLGPVHMRLAAALARNPDRSAVAREALASADAWVARWAADRDGEARNWRVEADDVAGAAEAYYRLDGVDVAIAWLRRWSPIGFALDAAAGLAARVAEELGPDSVWDALRASSAPAAVHPAFLAYAASPTARPDAGWLESTIEVVTRSASKEREPWRVRLLDTVLRYARPEGAASLAQHWAGELPGHLWGFSNRNSDGVQDLRCHAVVGAMSSVALDIEALVPASLRSRKGENGQREDPRQRERSEWIGAVRPLGVAAFIAARAAAGQEVRDEVVKEIDDGLGERLKAAGRRWFKHDATFRSWATMLAEAAADAGIEYHYMGQLADAGPALLRESAPHLWLDLAEVLHERGLHGVQVAELCMRAATALRGGAYSAADRLEFLTRAANIAGRVEPVLGQQLFGYALDAATGINDDAARLLSVHADLARRAPIAPEGQASLAARLVRAAEDMAPHVTESTVIPYASIAGAAARLDVGVGLATVSRWDDEDRIRWSSTLSQALTGSIDGGGLAAEEALLLDHLLENDDTRLNFQLSVMNWLTGSPARVPRARLALTRAARWIRQHVAARSQPALAQRLLQWAVTHGLDSVVRSDLEPVIGLTPAERSRPQPAWTPDWSPRERSVAVQGMLDNPRSRSWASVLDDIAQLEEALVYGEQLRSFVMDVAGTAALAERVEALAEVAKLPGRHGAETALPVLVELIGRWREWPGVSEWAASALPQLVSRWLTSLAWRDDTTRLLQQLRAFADDGAIRRAVLMTLPESRTELTAYGWQNIASLLGQLCQPTDAATALIGLLNDRNPSAGASDIGHDDPPAAEALPLLLWSAFGHPRRDMRWRACHTTRDLCFDSAPTTAAGLVASLVGFLGRTSLGSYRDRALHFYRFSADASALVALARVAVDRPDLLTPHTGILSRIATSRDLPHAQIRELARSAALAVIGEHRIIPDGLVGANRPRACIVDSRHLETGSDRDLSDNRRYQFDRMDTIPYWYSPLGRVFGVPVDIIAERAERWILDKWGGSEDDWMTDARELRDERAWGRMNNGHGSIPPEENLRLYLEYHALLVTAGELIDEGQPVCYDQWDDGAQDLWHDWLREHLPVSSGRWLADVRSPVPAAAELFGQLPVPDEWETARDVDHDCALGLVDGQLSDEVWIDAGISLHGPDGWANTYICSAFVQPLYAADLQRALAAAADPRDWKLPDEGEEQFEIRQDPYVVYGWLRRTHNAYETLDQHDPYAYELNPVLPMPGEVFRANAGLVPGPTGHTLLGRDGSVVAHAEQWADPRTDEQHVVSSSGARVAVQRTTLLHYLESTGTNLIVEVQIGRHRRDRGTGGYQPPRSRLYLIDGHGYVASS